MQKEFLDHLKFERRYSDHTVESYSNDLRQLREYLDAFDDELSMADLQTFHVRNWVVDLMDQDYAISSVQRKLSTVKSFCRFLRKRGYREDNPVSPVLAPKAAKRLPQFVLFYTTGMRLSELIGLRESDVEEDGRLIRVTGKRNKQRMIPLTESVSAMLLDYIKMKSMEVESTDILLTLDSGEKLYGRFVYRKVNEYLGRVTSLSKKSPHVLRHTFATHMLENGAELQSIKEILGHASLAATQVYTHNTIDRLKKIHTQAHPRG
jgi:integrase/recombinase XerC